MSSVDFSKLSYAQLREFSRSLDLQIAEKRTEELKVLADGYVKEIQASGFSIEEAVQALTPYLPVGAKRAAGPGARTPTSYRDPSNPANAWSGRGRTPKWLADYESAGRSRADFKV